MLTRFSLRPPLGPHIPVHRAGELEVLAVQQLNLDGRSAIGPIVAQTGRRLLPENLVSRASPGPIEGLDLRHALLPELLRDVAIGRISQVAALLLAFTKVRLQSLAHARIQRSPE